MRSKIAPTLMELVISPQSLPSKHEALAQCRADVVSESQTIGKHQPDIGQAPRVCWVVGTDIDVRFGHAQNKQGCLTL